MVPAPLRNEHNFASPPQSTPVRATSSNAQGQSRRDMLATCLATWASGDFSCTGCASRHVAWLSPGKTQNWKAAFSTAGLLRALTEVFQCLSCLKGSKAPVYLL